MAVDLDDLPSTAITAPEQGTGGRARTAKLVLILGSLSAFGPLSTDMYLPSLPAMAADFHATAIEIQLTLTACVLGLGFGQMIAGPLSDTLGRRRPLLVGLALFTAFSVACAVAPSASTLVLFRWFQALGGAAGLVIARAVVRDLYSGRALARFFSMLMLVMGVAPILAPVLGGQLILITSWRGVFLVLAVVGLGLLIVTATGLPETLPADQRSRGSLRATMRTYARLVTDRGYLGHVLTGALGFSAMFAYISGSSFVLQDIYGLSAQQFSLVFGVNALGIVVMGQVNGRLLLERYAPGRLVVTGLLLTLAGGLVLLLAVLLGLGLPAVLPALFVVVASVGLIMPNATALALGDYPDVAGSASALLGVAQFVIGGLVAPLVGLGGSTTALPMAVVVAALPVVALVVSATLRPHR